MTSGANRRIVSTTSAFRNGHESSPSWPFDVRILNVMTSSGVEATRPCVTPTTVSARVSAAVTRTHSLRCLTGRLMSENSQRTDCRSSVIDHRSRASPKASSSMGNRPSMRATGGCCGASPSMKLVSAQALEHGLSVCDDMDRYVPRRSFAAHQRWGLVVADHDHHEVAVGTQPQIPVKRRIRIGEPLDIAWAEIQPVGIIRPGAVEFVCVVRIRREHTRPIRLIGWRRCEGGVGGDSREEHERRTPGLGGDLEQSRHVPRQTGR